MSFSQEENVSFRRGKVYSQPCVEQAVATPSLGSQVNSTVYIFDKTSTNPTHYPMWSTAAGSYVLPQPEQGTAELDRGGRRGTQGWRIRGDEISVPQ